MSGPAGASVRLDLSANSSWPQLGLANFSERQLGDRGRNARRIAVRPLRRTDHSSPQIVFERLLVLPFPILLINDPLLGIVDAGFQHSGFFVEAAQLLQHVGRAVSAERISAGWAVGRWPSGHTFR
jgi:hypothetical protein